MADKDEVFWIKLLPVKFIADVDLQMMSASQRGVAFWLWMLLYCNNGKLKCTSNALASGDDYDVKSLAMTCRASEDDVRFVVATKFQVKNGFIISKKVDEVLEKAQARIDKAVKAAKAKWDKQKASTSQADTQAMLTHESSNAIDRKKDRKKDNNNITLKNELKTAFDEWWNVYPRRVGKPAAEKKFYALKPTGEVLEKIMAATKILAEQAQAGKFAGDKGQLQFCPHPTTWLNQGRYTDESEAQGEQQQGGNAVLGTHEATEEEIEKLIAEGVL